MQLRSSLRVLPCAVIGISALLVYCSSTGTISGNGPSAGHPGNNGGGVPMTPLPDGGPLQGTTVVGQTDGVFPKGTPLPILTNVVGREREDSVAIDFDPVEGAVDYRVYPLPADGDVSVAGSGLVTVKNATYRCAGVRQAWDALNSENASATDLALGNGIYSWKIDIPTNPTLGYVYMTPATDRAPVYAVAGDIRAPEYGWRETRLKIYTTDTTVRQGLLDKNWRDDGIVFYVPTSANVATNKVYSSQKMNGDQTQQYYFGDADMGTHATDTTPPTLAFNVLATASADTQPLMASTYQAGQVHTELSPGKERFKRATSQGQGPAWHVEWSGITAPTTLVVEALSSGCPYQGLLSATHRDATTADGTSAPHQPFFTLDEIRKNAPSGEVFVNGEYDVQSNPKAIARSFVKVTPQPHNAADWDWYQGFGADLGTTTEIKTASNCWMCGHWTTPAFDITTYNIDAPGGATTATFGTVLGQLLFTFSDWASDVTGKVRMTALQKANVTADKFLHAKMSVDIVSTDRRYPQLIISDQSAPVQEGFQAPDGNGLIVQAINGPSMRIEAQAIHGLLKNGGPWDVNNQAPSHAFMEFDQQDTELGYAPTLPAFEYAGPDRTATFDVFVSPSKMYLFLDGQPAGCTLYPSNFTLNGDVTVTFGAVLYHEGAPDELVCVDAKPYSFLHSHQCTETQRHFDDLAFKSGANLPPWDEAKFPCAAY